MRRGDTVPAGLGAMTCAGFERAALDVYPVLASVYVHDNTDRRDDMLLMVSAVADERLGTLTPNGLAQTMVDHIRKHEHFMFPPNLRVLVTITYLDDLTTEHFDRISEVLG